MIDRADYRTPPAIFPKPPLRRGFLFIASLLPGSVFEKFFHTNGLVTGEDTRWDNHPLDVSWRGDKPS